MIKINKEPTSVEVSLSESTAKHKITIKTRTVPTYGRSEAYISMSCNSSGLSSLGAWITDEEIDELVTSLQYIKKLRELENGV